MFEPKKTVPERVNQGQTTSSSSSTSEFIQLLPLYFSCDINRQNTLASFPWRPSDGAGVWPSVKVCRYFHLNVQSLSISFCTKQRESCFKVNKQIDLRNAKQLTTCKIMIMIYDGCNGRCAIVVPGRVGDIKTKTFQDTQKMNKLFFPRTILRKKIE
jgi:hypothetical protein